MPLKLPSESAELARPGRDRIWHYESRDNLQRKLQDQCSPSDYPSSGPSPATGVMVNDVLPDGTVDIADLSALAG
jgi:hypothetical protein